MLDARSELNQSNTTLKGFQIIHFDPEFLITFANHKSQISQTNDENRHKRRKRISNKESILSDLQADSDNLQYSSRNNNVRDESEWLEISNRDITLECDSPVNLTEIFMTPEGFDEISPGIFDFKSDDMKLTFEMDESLLVIKTKNVAKLKSKLLMSFNFQKQPHVSELVETLKSEIAILNIPSSKLNYEHLCFYGPVVHLVFNTIINKVNININYNIKMRSDMNSCFTPDIINKISHLILVRSLRLEIEDENQDNQKPYDPITPQLFYKSISDSTFMMPSLDNIFDIPELETHLLKFQRKTVNWLLENEGMKYDWSTNRSIPSSLIEKDLVSMIERYFNNEETNLEEIDKKANIVLNKLCFGWTRVVMDDTIHWFNKYTCYLNSRNFIYKFLRDYYNKEYNSKRAAVLPAQGLLAEEMGLGKTVEITTLVLMNQRPIDSVNEPIEIQLEAFGDIKTVITGKTTLIIAPDSILKQWTEEIIHLAPSLAVTIYNGIDKYPKLENNAGLIAEYLRKFDVVFTTYSTISRELDYALYSSRNKPTRNSTKRKSTYFASEEVGSDEDIELSRDNQCSNTFDNDDYKSMFQLSLQAEKPKVANVKTNEHLTETDYEKALQDEIELAIKHNRVANIYNRHEYQSPLMLIHFWRVVLDEVQMVSSKLSRAFQSAALIPRFHAWGVSGTPIKKNLDDLHSILRFLKFRPFSGNLSKNSWSVLTTINDKNTNVDFIRLWSQISLRHTKAMVHDDIKLPPQSRVLMTIPFTPVEQENYNQMFEECLAAICLDSNGNPVLSDWEPSSTITTYMRYWLVRLRQVCCNPQIGKLNLNSKKYKSKNYNNRVVTMALQLKTLENVLDDMLIKASDQITNAEASIIQVYIDAAQFQEYILIPEVALEFLEIGAFEIQQILHRLNLVLAKYIEEYGEYRRRFNLKPINIEEYIDGENDDMEVLEDDVSSIDGVRETLVKYQDQIRASRLRIRSCNISLHKFYFLIASCNFQCYDEEYREKIKKYRLGTIPLSEGLNDLKLYNKNTKDISSLISGISVDEFDIKKPDYLCNFRVDPSIPDNEKKVSEHKYLELKYYELAEITRQDILKSSIQTVNRAVNSKILSRLWYNNKDSNFIDSGLNLLPKTSKKFFNALPTINTDTLKDFVMGMKSKFYVEKLERLVIQLNAQCQVINEWMLDMIRILSKPLLSHDKTPDGEEYEESIEDQDKVSCYLHVLSQILIDRNEFIVGDETTMKISVLKTTQEQRDLEAEMNKIHNRVFLNDLQGRRLDVKPTTKSSLQELVHDIKNLETELKDVEFLDPDSKEVEIDLFGKISERVRVIFGNQKLAQVLLQKELNLSCNFVFNTRIEYFKQLQQISDSVKPRQYPFKQEDLKAIHIIEEHDLYSRNYREINSTLGKSIAKFRYLQTLIKKEDNEDKSTLYEEEEDLMCIICRSTITIGSLTQCGHKYCKECLELWLRNHKTCPMCKYSINTSTIYNFTHHKPNLKANTVNNAIVNRSNDNIHSIYKSIDDGIIEDIQSIHLKNSYSSKVDMIVKQVIFLRNKDPSVQIIIFSQWQDLLYIIGTAFKSSNISFLGSHGTLTPEVGAGRRRNKYDSVEEFKNPNNQITCFLLNAKAQASGLTLVNATHIFLCEPLVNTSLELQAISRIHRIGQTRTTTVWMFAIENTVEESIVLMSTNKRLQYFEPESTPISGEKTLPNENSTKLTNSKVKEKNLSKAESMTLMKSGGIDTLVNKGNGEGESVTNGDLWNAFFCARAANPPISTLGELKNT